MSAFNAGDRLRNRHTGSIQSVVKVEQVPYTSPTATVTVYTLSDGNRWQEAQLVENWSAA